MCIYDRCYKRVHDMIPFKIIFFKHLRISETKEIREQDAEKFVRIPL